MRTPAPRPIPSPAASGPTEFQSLLVVRAAAASRWLVRSVEACGGRGSATYYSRWYRPLRGWSWPYPETTGYLIPTLIEYSRFASQPRLAELALQQADWVLSLQRADGALPGGAVVRGRVAGPSIFNTGQMILGLVAAADHSRDRRYLEGAAGAAAWLAGEVDSAAGIWHRHGYVGGFAPAYYTRVCWPMLEVWARTGDDAVRAVALSVLNTISGWQLPNGAIQHWGFRPNRPAFTHTIAYTLDGLLESARLLGDAGARFEAAAIKTAEVLRRKLELRGRLAGAYDLDFRGRYWYTCLTGNCQMALVWMRVADRLADARYLSAALKALQVVIGCQRMRALDRNVRGAVAGSSPVWGRYLTLRYPNWAAKFYLDALLNAHARLQRLLEHGPCASP